MSGPSWSSSISPLTSARSSSTWGGYFDGLPVDRATDLRRQTIFALQDMGIRVEYTHHEVAPSQHEIDLRYDEALKMADKVMTYRTTVKEIARQNGVYATFMPKPIFGQNGSGMHTHQSLFKGSKNAFFDGSDKYQPLEDGQELHRRPHDPRPGDHRDLQPVDQLLQAAGPRLRGAGLRLLGAPEPLGHDPRPHVQARARRRRPGSSTALPIRPATPIWPLPSCWPRACKGVEKAYPLPEPIEEDIFEMDEKAREKAGITSLPGSLYEALMRRARGASSSAKPWATTSSTSSSRTRRWNGTGSAPMSASSKSIVTCRCCKSGRALRDAGRELSDFPLRTGNLSDNSLLFFSSHERAVS